MRQVPLGWVVGRGETIRRGKTIAFEANLFDGIVKPLGRESVTTALTPLPDLNDWP